MLLRNGEQYSIKCYPLLDNGLEGHLSPDCWAQYLYQVSSQMSYKCLTSTTVFHKYKYWLLIFLFFSFFWKYLYTYLTNVLKGVLTLLFKSSSGFVACVPCVCACFCWCLLAKHSSATASMMFSSGLQSALAKLIL